MIRSPNIRKCWYFILCFSSFISKMKIRVIFKTRITANRRLTREKVDRRVLFTEQSPVMFTKWALLNYPETELHISSVLNTHDHLKSSRNMQSTQGEVLPSKCRSLALQGTSRPFWRSQTPRSPIVFFAHSYFFINAQHSVMLHCSIYFNMNVISTQASQWDSIPLS